MKFTFPVALKNIFIFFTLFLARESVYAQQAVTLSGIVQDEITSQGLNDALLLIQPVDKKTTTNYYGFFSVVIQPTNFLLFNVIKEGYIIHTIPIQCTRDTFITINLGAIKLKEITVTGDTMSNFISRGGNKFSISKAQLDKLPIIMGEKDILRALQTMPGVLPSNETSNGINVRGGGADQNLFILDDIPIYSVKHLFGMLSTFNDDILKEVNFYTAAFPARYGGKLSSVVDCITRDGSVKKAQTNFAISPIAAKISFEAPIIKDRSSILVSIRRSYLDFISEHLMPGFTSYKNYNFTDANLKFNYALNAKNKIFVSSYWGEDVFRNKLIAFDDYSSVDGNRWSNTGANVRWNCILNSKSFLNTSITWSAYKFIASSDFIINLNNMQDRFSYKTTLNSKSVRVEYCNFISNKWAIKAGLNASMYNLTPGLAQNKKGEILNLVVYNYQPKEYAGYLQLEYKSKSFEFAAGLRHCIFVSDTVFNSLEPRISIKTLLSHKLSIAASYDRMSQPLHELSNTSTNIPTDLWGPSTKKIDIEKADIISFTTQLKMNRFTNISIAGYYKWMNNVIEYLPGKPFFSLRNAAIGVFPNWEKSITQGKGNAYGLEFYFEKQKNNFSVNIAYTLSWSIRTFEKVNFGKPFYSPFDRRHNLSTNASYQFKRPASRKNNVILNSAFIFQSANPTRLFRGSVSTYVLGTFYSEGANVDLSSTTTARIEPTHRLDIAVQLKRARDGRRTWEFGIYNVYNRANPFYYTFEIISNAQNMKELKVRKNSLLPILPYISFKKSF